MRANGFGYKTKSYEWMTHKSFHEVTRAECRDWMKVNIEGKKKKKKEAALLHYARCIRPSSTERVAGWICIHGVDPWENVSLGCTVSHIRSHLENHLPTFLCSSSLYPPLALLVHSRITPPPKKKKDSFTDLIHPKAVWLSLLRCCFSLAIHTAVIGAFSQSFLRFGMVCSERIFDLWKKRLHNVRDIFMSCLVLLTTTMLLLEAGMKTFVQADLPWLGSSNSTWPLTSMRSGLIGLIVDTKELFGLCHL